MQHRQPRMGSLGKLLPTDNLFREEPRVMLVGFSNEAPKISVTSTIFRWRKRSGQQTDKGKKKEHSWWPQENSQCLIQAM